jgi:AraC family transcriptional regulator
MADYAHRVHLVMDHIRGHLAEDLSLSKLAAVAHFSPYHFHRVFKGVVGETVAAFTRRARLERAIYLMRGAPHRELTSIALEVGFKTPSDFSRVFRSVYGVAPSHWDRKSRLDDVTAFTDPDATTPDSMPVQRVRHEACRVAYVRVNDPWTGTGLTRGYASLRRWYREHGGDCEAATLVGMSWDSDKATPIERLQYDLGFVLEPGFRHTDGVGVHVFPAIDAVEVHCTSLRQTATAWDYLYERWLPASGYEPDEMPAIKRFRRAPEVFDANAWDLDCSIAIRRTLSRP